MSNELTFHNLREGGIVRELAPGLTARHVKAGDFWQTPPNVPHGGRALGVGAVVLDIFAPPREEYRTAGRGLGAAAVSAG